MDLAVLDRCQHEFAPRWNNGVSNKSRIVKNTGVFRFVAFFFVSSTLGESAAAFGKMRTTRRAAKRDILVGERCRIHHSSRFLCGLTLRRPTRSDPAVESRIVFSIFFVGGRRPRPDGHRRSANSVLTSEFSMMSPPSKTKNNETATFYGWRRRIDLLQLVVKENQYSPYRGGQVAAPAINTCFFCFYFPRITEKRPI